MLSQNFEKFFTSNLHQLLHVRFQSQAPGVKSKVEEVKRIMRAEKECEEKGRERIELPIQVGYSFTCRSSDACIILILINISFLKISKL